MEGGSLSKRNGSALCGARRCDRLGIHHYIFTRVDASTNIMTRPVSNYKAVTPSDRALESLNGSARARSTETKTLVWDNNSVALVCAP